MKVGNVTFGELYEFKFQPEREKLNAVIGFIRKMRTLGCRNPERGNCEILTITHKAECFPTCPTDFSRDKNVETKSNPLSGLWELKAPIGGWTTIYNAKRIRKLVLTLWLRWFDAINSKWSLFIAHLEPFAKDLNVYWDLQPIGSGTFEPREPQTFVW